MEEIRLDYQRKHRRERIGFNVLLTGAEDLQRGCRAVDVSESGMLLAWSPRESDVRNGHEHVLFEPGMFVNILFLTGKNRKANMGISGSVVRSESNRIAVQFHHEQTDLLEQIKQMDKEQPEQESDRETGQQQPKQVIQSRGSPGYIPFLYGIAVSAVAILSWNLLSDDPSSNESGNLQPGMSVNASETASNKQLVRVDKIETTPMTPADQPTQPEPYLQAVLTPPAPKVDEMDESAAEASGPAAMAQPSPETTASDTQSSHPSPPEMVQPLAKTTASAAESSDPPSSKTAVAGTTTGPSPGPVADPSTQLPAAAAGKTTSIASREKGNWSVALAALSREASADSFVERAKTLGIAVVKTQVEVKGKTFWRLRIHGFESRDEAKAYGKTAREKLGLKEVIVLKQD